MSHEHNRYHDYERSCLHAVFNPDMNNTNKHQWFIQNKKRVVWFNKQITELKTYCDEIVLRSLLAYFNKICKIRSVHVMVITSLNCAFLNLLYLYMHIMIYLFTRHLQIEYKFWNNKFIFKKMLCAIMYHFRNGTLTTSWLLNIHDNTTIDGRNRSAVLCDGMNAKREDNTHEIHGNRSWVTVMLFIKVIDYIRIQLILEFNSPSISLCFDWRLRCGCCTAPLSAYIAPYVATAVTTVAACMWILFCIGIFSLAT